MEGMTKIRISSYTSDFNAAQVPYALPKLT